MAATQDDVSSSLTYYVDGLKGDDQNTGTAPEESWRSVDRANRADFDPDDPKNLSNHSSNGIVAGGVEGGLIEYCEAFNNGWDMPHKGVTLR